MATSKFKVGDRVRDESRDSLGMGTVVSVHNRLVVIFDSYYYGPKDINGNYTNWHFITIPSLVLVKRKHNQGYIDLVSLQEKLKDTIYA